MVKSIKNIWRSLGVTFVICALLCGVSVGMAGEYPDWWMSRGVIDASTTVTTNDYAAVNQGQLKWIATKAYEELQSSVGVNQDLTDLVSSFTASNNYKAVNRGQLKYVASKFWNRLIETGHAVSLPWTNNPASSDYAMANVGQVKYIFNFELSGDPVDPVDNDDDGLLDSWEMQIVNADPDDDITMVEHVRPQDDFDGDGASNADELLYGTSPIGSTAKPPMISFDSSQTVVSETNGIANVALSISPAPVGNVSATVSVIGGTAESGVDYTFAPSVVNFSAVTLNATVNLILLPDALREPQENIILNLGNVLDGGMIASGSTHEVVICNDLGDGDGDGISDAWEIRKFGDLSRDGTLDYDNDGWNDLKEFKLGGDPTVSWNADTNNILKLTIKTPLRD